MDLGSIGFVLLLLRSSGSLRHGCRKGVLMGMYVPSCLYSWHESQYDENPQRLAIRGINPIKVPIRWYR